MCRGAAISSHIEPTLRCPFRAFVGFEKDMKEGDLLEVYSVFYESYNNMLDVFDALRRANSIIYSLERRDAKTQRLLRSSWVFDKSHSFGTNRKSHDRVVAFRHLKR